MAFSKMAGFEVTPPRASSPTRRFSSPPAMRLRRMKSSHTDWPYWRREATGLATAAGRKDGLLMTPSPRNDDGRLAVAALQGDDLGEAPRVALLARVAGGHEGPHQLVGEGGAHDASAQDEHVHVVVLDPLVGRVGVVADGGPHAGQLVGGDRRPHPAAADEDAALPPALAHGQADRLREVGVVHGRGRARPHVDHLVPLLAEGLRHLLLEQEARVVGADDDLHRPPTLSFIDPPPYPSPRRGRETLFRDVLRAFSPTAGFVASDLAAKLFPRGGHHVPGVEAELLLQVLEGGGG